MFSKYFDRPGMPDGARRARRATRQPMTTTSRRLAAVISGALLAASLAPLAAIPGSAATAGTGPVDSVNGYPAWYSDGTVRLQLCYEADKGCLSEPPDPSLPAAYPDNFPDESFWFAAMADVGTIGAYEAALEAAHVNEAVIDGDQMGFGRLRFRFGNLQPNQQYTITHPYGVHTFTSTPDPQDASLGEINVTLDEGCEPTATAPCDWEGVGAAFLGDYTTGSTATFLRQVGAEAGTLGSIDTARTVTGAPSGNNFVRVVGPDAGGPGVNTVTTNLFTVQGLISQATDGAPSTPDLAAASDSGRSTTDNVTTVTTPTVTGTLPAGTTGPVQLVVDGGAPQTATLTGSTYSLKLALLAPGRHTVQARAGALVSGTLTFTVEPVVSQDFNGDGRADLVARDSSGVLWTYLGNGAGSFPNRIRVGAGWNVMNSISATGDLTGDGRADIVARDRSGVLWTYQGNGSGTFPTRVRVGAGWNIMKTISAASDVTGDGRNDLLAVDSSGVLWSYRGNNTGTFPTRIRAGAGWGTMAISAAGDLNRDGKADLVARDASGVLWSYMGNAAGAFPTRVRAGAGWNAMNAISGAADLNSDGRDDLVARDRSGVLWSYLGSGTGTFPNRIRVGAGWNIMNALG